MRCFCESHKQQQSYEWLAIHYQYTTIFSYFIVSTLQGRITNSVASFFDPSLSSMDRATLNMLFS